MTPERSNANDNRKMQERAKRINDRRCRERTMACDNRILNE